MTSLRRRHLVPPLADSRHTHDFPATTPSSSVPLKISESPSRVQQRGIDLGGGARRRTANRVGPSAFSLRHLLINRTGSRGSSVPFFLHKFGSGSAGGKASNSALHATGSPHRELREIVQEAGVAIAPSLFIYRQQRKRSKRWLAPREGVYTHIRGETSITRCLLVAARTPTGLSWSGRSGTLWSQSRWGVDPSLR